ncbi:MAG: hypothetical protein LYZ69_01725 [Nitrososphaerales archaeon]|nr:hypothetical protein [Nitrososphaerales archaeon]
MLDESAVLHLNGSDFVLATSQTAPALPGYSRVDLAKPLDLTFAFSNESYTSNAQQGRVYPAHIAVNVEMSVVSNGTVTPVSFTDGPVNMQITLDTERPIARAQSDSLVYLVASEVVGFAGIVFLMKAVKIGDDHKGVR